MTPSRELDTPPAVAWRSINSIRALAMDAVEQAQSGHPGTPMALAPAAYVLWTRFLRHNPANPDWADRDRFVLSCGHASMLLYSVLHLSGYDLPLDEVRNFRQWGSRTPGHPERGHTTGVETTTGPLGQGFGNAVGMAMTRNLGRPRGGPTGDRSSVARARVNLRDHSDTRVEFDRSPPYEALRPRRCAPCPQCA